MKYIMKQRNHNENTEPDFQNCFNSRFLVVNLLFRKNILQNLQPTRIFFSDRIIELYQNNTENNTENILCENRTLTMTILSLLKSSSHSLFLCFLSLVHEPYHLFPTQYGSDYSQHPQKTEGKENNNRHRMDESESEGGRKGERRLFCRSELCVTLNCVLRQLESKAQP